MTRSRTILLVTLALVLAGLLFWLWAGRQGQARVVQHDAQASHKTIEYDGVEVEIPAEWERVDLSECEFQFEHWGPPDDSDCQGTSGVSFYGSATFDPALGPGVHANPDHAKHGDAAWAGYVEVSDTAVYTADDDRTVVERVLSSVTTIRK